MEGDLDNDNLVKETPDVLPQPVPIVQKPLIKDRGLNDEEFEQYIKLDGNYIAKSNYKSDIDRRMSEIESKYNFARGDVQGRLRANLSSGMDNTDFKDYRNMEFFMNAFGNNFEEKFKEVLKNWVDTPKDEDASKRFFRRGSVNLTNVRKETLPDGTKVYNTNQGYYDLYFDGLPGKKMDENELKKHGWVKTE